MRLERITRCCVSLDLIRKPSTSSFKLLVTLETGPRLSLVATRRDPRERHPDEQLCALKGCCALTWGLCASKNSKRAAPAASGLLLLSTHPVQLGERSTAQTVGRAPELCGASSSASVFHPCTLMPRFKLMIERAWDQPSPQAGQRG